MRSFHIHDHNINSNNFNSGINSSFNSNSFNGICSIHSGYNRFGHNTESRNLGYQPAGRASADLR